MLNQVIVLKSRLPLIYLSIACSIAVRHLRGRLLILSSCLVAFSGRLVHVQVLVHRHLVDFSASLEVRGMAVHLVRGRSLRVYLPSLHVDSRVTAVLLHLILCYCAHQLVVLVVTGMLLGAPHSQVTLFRIDGFLDGDLLEGLFHAVLLPLAVVVLPEHEAIHQLVGVESRVAFVGRQVAGVADTTGHLSVG